jgi:3-dehydroquinate dehydratase type I
LSVKVCVSVPPKTVDEAIQLIQKAEAQHADLIEVRLDSLKTHDNIAEILQHSKTPLIATNKSTEQHGQFSGTETQRQKVLLGAARDGFEYVDVDLGTPNPTKLISTLKESGTKVIVSFHDFEKTPPITELNKVLVEQLALGADVCKLVTTARTVNDNLVTLDFVSEASKNAKIVCFAMGEKGKPSRLLSPVFGGFFTFASLDKKRKTAKGQLTIQEMRIAYKALGIK